MANRTRKVMRRFNGVQTTDGAGVKLRRVLGYHQQREIDPFLLFDQFGSENPNDYIAGFPWHPHRGIETVTYMISGETEHADSLGNKGVIGPGDLQWMSAGSGIIHQEMPQNSPEGLKGFQLWVNLPKSEKMSRPKYRDILAESIPIVELEGAKVRVIAGSFGGATGPIREVAADPLYLDVELAPHARFELEIPAAQTVIAYLFEGEAVFGSADGADRLEESGGALLLGDGDGVAVRGGKNGCRFLLFGGQPLGEPIAWRGPIVMNSDAEIRTAFRELEEGTFIKENGVG